MELYDLFERIKNSETKVYTSRFNDILGRDDVPRDQNYGFCILREPAGVFVDPDISIQKSFEHHRYSKAIAKIAEEKLREANIVKEGEEITLFKIVCFELFHVEGHLVYFLKASATSSLATALFKKILIDSALRHDKEFDRIKRTVDSEENFLEQLVLLERERHEHPEEKVADEYAVQQMKDCESILKELEASSL